MITSRIACVRGCLIGVVLALSGTSAAWAATATKKADALPHRLNIAEQEKMLGERLTRTWAMKSLGTLRVRANIQFDEDARRYARQLRTLQAEADTPDLKENYALLEQLWNKYLQLSEASAADSNIKELSDQNEELTRTAEKGANILRQRMGAEQSEGLRLAGQARALSQRMAKLYFFRSLGATAPFIAADMKKAEADYLTSIKRLRELSEDRPKSANILALVDQQWLFFSEVLRTPAAREDRDQVYQTLAKSSDSLLSALEDLSTSFE